MASSAAAGTASQGGRLSNRVCRGLRLSNSVSNRAGAAITASCEVSTVRMKSSMPPIGEPEILTKKCTIRISVPQQAAAATVGVGRRWLQSRRSQSPTSSRSLARNRTDSRLNCSTAQRIDSTQAMTVTTITTGENWTACQ